MTLSLSVGRISCYFNPTTGLFEAQIGSNGAAGSQLYAYQPSTLSVIPLTTDAAGNLMVSGGSSGGGTVTQGPAAALAGAWPVELTDGTNGPAAVKAASTAAVATDKALVVAVSPNSAVAVTGTFWQATQPVSGTVTTTPPTDATTNLTKVGGTAVTLGAKTSAASIPVVLASDEAALAVTGTFWQATQPVSGTVTGNQGTANTAANAWPAKITDGTNIGAVKAASTAAVAADPAQVVAISPNNSVAVTGTFWQATQPVSGTVTTTPPANATTNVAQFGGANVVTGTGASAAGVPRVTVSNDSNVLVTPPTLTKGTQGATGFSVQDLRDAGRNQTNYFMAAQIVSTATETLQSLTGYKGGIAVAATTTPAVVTAAKTYRLQSITITYVGIVTTPGAIQVNLRANLSGVVAIGSPLVCSWLVGEELNATPVAGDATTITIPLPDGVEFAAGTGIGITVLGVGATGTAAAVGYAKVSVLGFEY